MVTFAEFRNGLPQGRGGCHAHLAGKWLFTCNVERFVDGVSAGPATVQYADGSTYRGDMRPPDWIFVNSRKSGVLYRVSLAKSIFGVVYEKVPC